MSLARPTDQQARILWASLTALGVTILIALLGFLIWLMGRVLDVLAPVLWPLAIGGILAYLLDPIVDFCERKRIPRRRAIVLVFVVCAAAVLAVFASVVPRLVFEAKNLIEHVPQYSRDLQANATKWLERQPDWRQRLEGLLPRRNPVVETNTPPLEVPIPTQDTTTNTAVLPGPSAPPEAWAAKLSQAVLDWLGQTIPKVGSWVLAQLGRVASWAGMLIGLTLVPVFTYYFLLEKAKIQAGWTKYLPLTESRIKDELVFILNSINNYLIVFFRGQVVIAMCNAVMLTIGFAIMGLNYAVLVGVVAGLLSIIPYLGTIITIIPAIVLAAVQFKDFWHPLFVVGVYSIANVVEGFFISPKIMGDRVGLHPLTIIVALLVGTTLLGGVLGGILAIPLTAALRVIMFRYVWKPRTKPA
jgi:predicted PurR-regulated permease PerM